MEITTVTPIACIGLTKEHKHVDTLGRCLDCGAYVNTNIDPNKDPEMGGDSWMQSASRRFDF